MKPLLLLICALAVVTGCATKKKKPPEPTGQATLIGMIEMVNPEQNYVLIRCEPMPSLEPGVELIALSASGQRSKLVLTPERKGHYITADIKEGQPGVTNLVLLQRSALPAVPPPVAPAPTPVAPNPSAFQPMPSLPGVMPGANNLPTIPLEPTLPPASPAVAPAKGFDGLEPPVGAP